MDNPFPVRKFRFFSAKSIWISILLVVLVVGGGLFFLLGLSTLQIRLNGVQTTAIAHEDGVCEGDSNSPGDSYSFTYEFTGPHGQQYRIARDSFCTNVYQDGDHITIWYMPDNPSQMTTDLDVHVLYLFSGIGVLVTSILLGVPLVTFMVRKRVTRTNVYANYPYNQGRYR